MSIFNLTSYRIYKSIVTASFPLKSCAPGRMHVPFKHTWYGIQVIKLIQHK